MRDRVSILAKPREIRRRKAIGPCGVTSCGSQLHERKARLKAHLDFKH